MKTAENWTNRAVGLSQVCVFGDWLVVVVAGGIQRGTTRKARQTVSGRCVGGKVSGKICKVYLNLSMWVPVTFLQMSQV